MNEPRSLTAEEYAAAKPYAIVIEWSEEDGVYIATAPRHSRLPHARRHAR
jgi:hypothetical protein